MKIQSATFAVEADLPRSLSVVPRKGEGGASAAGASGAGTGAQAAPAAGTQQVPSPQPVQASGQEVARQKESSDQQALAEQLQRYLKANSSKLDISLDKDLNMIVTKVLSSETGEVLKQYPPESVIEVLKYLRQQKGALVNEKG